MSSLGLADAIRLGSKMGPQIFGTLRSGDGTCALGAALITVGGSFDMVLRGAVFPELAVEVEKCPGCELFLFNGTFTVVKLMIHLNDAHLWTREAIADWIDDLLFNRMCDKVVAEPSKASTPPTEKRFAQEPVNV